MRNNCSLTGPWSGALLVAPQLGPLATARRRAMRGKIKVRAVYTVFEMAYIVHECGQVLLVSKACALMKVEREEEEQIEREKENESAHVRCINLGIYCFCLRHVVWWKLKGKRKDKLKGKGKAESYKCERSFTDSQRKIDILCSKKSWN